MATKRLAMQEVLSVVPKKNPPVRAGFSSRFPVGMTEGKATADSYGMEKRNGKRN